MIDYHGRMMNIQITEGQRTSADNYAAGHRDARHAAAEIALEADAQIAALTAERDGRKKQFETEREWRHRYDATCREFLVDENRCCSECGGSGYQVYGSTATWRGGVGGQAMTMDVCSKCWGSGDNEKHWPSHRAALKGSTNG